jgi:2-methylisocitrate lyase-like PEP mutase family enzyme
MPVSASGPARLRTLLAAPNIVVAPGAYDALTARLIEQAGFPAVYMTGAGVSAAHGFPDYGLLTLNEMVESAGVIVRSISAPLISDADTGYGNELNVTRTVREFEIHGVAAIQIEDQVSPKRCGHFDGKEVVSREEFISKIRAAAAARRNPDFAIIARTDAGAVIHFKEAIDRANLAIAAGADIAFVEAVPTFEEMAAVPQSVRGPCLLNIVPGGKTPPVPLADAQAMGYRLAILPGLLLREVIVSIERVLKTVIETKVQPVRPVDATLLNSLRQLFHADEWDALRQAHDPPVTAGDQ